MRPKPMLWPRQERTPGDAAQPGGRATAAPAPATEPLLVTLPPWLRPARLLPFLAAALSAHLGMRLRLRVEQADPGAAADCAALGSIGTRDGTLLLAIDGDAAMELLSAIYGSDRALCPPETVMLPDLAPDSGSWCALGTLVRSAFARAMAESGAEAITAQPARLADAQHLRMHRTLISVHGPGVQAMLELRFAPAGDAATSPAMPQSETPPAATPPETGPADGWALRLDRLSRGVPLPVCLELHAQQMPLADVMQLGVGDVITLPAVRSMTMKVAGEPWAQVPMAALAGPDPANANPASTNSTSASKEGRP